MKEKAQISDMFQQFKNLCYFYLWQDNKIHETQELEYFKKKIMKIPETKKLTPILKNQDWGSTTLQTI